MFDTIFTDIGSTTKSFRVINPNNQPIKISNIRLAGGDKSSYRLNIDGDMTNDKSDIELLANDSLYIFVELTVNPNGVNQPIIVQDSIVFTVNSNIQDIDLLAWGQDFVSYQNEVIGTTTWTAEKPYVLRDTVVIDSDAVLTIEPGSRIYFHKGAGLYALGVINAVGTPESPIIFTTDRLEEMYNDIPDQWHGILLLPNKGFSVFENVKIMNAHIGLQIGALEYEGSARARLHNVKIEHMAYAGLFAINSQIEANNTVIADCGFYCVTLLVGGLYNFNHCTVANYWGGIGQPNRKTPSVTISNQLVYDNTIYVGALTTNWKNSIIWGDKESEIEFGNNKDYFFEFNFDKCVMKLDDSTYTSTPENFFDVIIKDPKFDSLAVYNYQLDTLSPAKDAGAIEYGELVPFDFNDISRLTDNAPDIGAYERVE